jgi:hypothetical protein
MFGFLNSGNMGFCLGDEHGSHFGVIFAGYETCCHKNKPEISHKQNQVTFGCECNDIDVEPVIISQSLFNISDFMHNIETIFASDIQHFVYNINFLTISKDKSIYYRKAPPDLFSRNSEIIKSSIILLI